MFKIRYCNSRCKWFNSNFNSCLNIHLPIRIVAYTYGNIISSYFSVTSSGNISTFYKIPFYFLTSTQIIKIYTICSASSWLRFIILTFSIFQCKSRIWRLSSFCFQTSIQLTKCKVPCRYRPKPTTCRQTSPIQDMIMSCDIPIIWLSILGFLPYCFFTICCI